MNRLGLRHLVNRLALTACLVLCALAILPLLSVLWEVGSRGARVVDWTFLTTLPRPPFSPGGGIKHAIVGTGMVVGIGTGIGAPVGLLTGIYLAEYGRGRFAETVRTVADAMAGIPSIVVGLFAYAVVVTRIGYSGWAAGFALAVIMVPVVTRTTEEALRAVPAAYREAGLALGAPRWYVVVTVILPAALSPVLTGLLLAVARIAGETAPLLLTALTSFFLVTDPAKPVPTLPVVIYDYGKSAFPKLQDQSWGAALVLIAFVLVINVTVRLLARRRVLVRG